jgi:predicted ATP-grasp superfamily ATP-dependent carboligase
MSDGSVGALNESQRPLVLLGATTWWPLSARLAMALLRHGCRVSAVCPPGHPLRFVSGVEALYPYRALDSLGALRAAILGSHPDLIVPADDGVVWQLHELHARHPELRSIIEQSLGPAETYPIIRSRDALLQTAVELGIRVPETRLVSSEADLDRWPAGSPCVLKLDGTWGGSGVAIVRSRAEAGAAFHKLSRPIGAGVVWKRWLVNHDPLAWWSRGKRDKSSVSIQQFIPGRPANAMIACWKGELLGIVSVEVLRSQGATGAATVVRLIQNEDMQKAACLLAHKLHLNGFHGLDFMIEEGSGLPYLIELNPRCTQLGHLRLPAQDDLAGMIAAKVAGAKQESQPVSTETSELEDLVRGNTIAFFPQALTWNPSSPYLRSAYHDVPWEEPALFRELLRGSWPERQFLSRIYHHFREAKRSNEEKF